MHTDNYFGETLQLETSDQPNKIADKLRPCWRVVRDIISMFQINSHSSSTH